MAWPLLPLTLTYTLPDCHWHLYTLSLTLIKQCHWHMILCHWQRYMSIVTMSLTIYFCHWHPCIRHCQCVSGLSSRLLYWYILVTVAVCRSTSGYNIHVSVAVSVHLFIRTNKLVTLCQCQHVGVQYRHKPLCLWQCVSQDQSLTCKWQWQCVSAFGNMHQQITVSVSMSVYNIDINHCVSGSVSVRIRV